MRTVWSIGLAVIAVTAILLLADRFLLNSPVIERDDRAGAAEAPRRVLSRLQADLERVAVGQAAWPLGPGARRDPVERLADALDALLRGQARSFRDHVDAVRADATRRLARQDDIVRAQGGSADLDKVVLPSAYAEALAEPRHAPPLLALAQAMRLADAALVLEAAEAGGQAIRYDLRTRRNLWNQGRDPALLDGVWLRLPCAVLKGRAAAFDDLARRLGDLAGPLLSCPLPDGAGRDFAFMERLLRRPGQFANYVVSVAPLANGFGDRPPPPPWDAAAALRFMDINPDGAEPPLRLATLNTVAARLDLALFLHTFRDPSTARDEDIRSLMAGVDRLSLSRATPDLLPLAGQPQVYDGSDASLVPSLRLAALTRSADVVSGNYSYPYAVPCAVRLRHPALAAVESLAAEDSGHPAPVSGCLVGRGRVPGFPEAVLAAFVTATAAADGGTSSAKGKTPRYPVRMQDAERMRAILFEPRAILDWPAPTVTYPYQTWGYASLTNRDTARRLHGLFEAAKPALAGYFKAKGLEGDEPVQAAERALFALARGANCGGAPPPMSLRRLLLDGGSAENLAAVLAEPAPERLKPFADCGLTAPFDSLAHLAVAHPALPLLWAAAGSVSGEGDPEGLAQLREVNARNHFGKTPLMVAAGFDRVDAARFLLEKGARVNAETWQPGRVPTMAHDARTALMYAAAQGSAAMVRLLLDAGADRFQADTKGRRAVHYLLGLGPLPANPVMSAAERSEMARLLY